MLTIIKNIDQDFFLHLNGMHHPCMDKIMYWFTSRLFWLPLYVCLIYFMWRTLGIKSLIIFVITITLCDQLSASVCKPWVQRLRPCCDPEIKNIVHLVGTYVGNYGFPSSHAANTFGISMALWLLFKKNYPWIFTLFTWALLVSYGRIYGGVHYPIDVIAGALLGIVTGWLSYRIYYVLGPPLNIDK